MQQETTGNTASAVWRYRRWLVWSLLLLLIAWAIFVRAWAVSERPFWVDEAWVAYAATQQSYGQLFRQTDLPMPPLFAAATKLLGSIVGPPELGLRLLPIACGIACVPLGYLILRTLRVPGSVALAAMSLTASSYILVRWSRELKQYEVEAFLSLLAALVVLRIRYCRPLRRRWLHRICLIAICLAGPWLGYGFVFPAAVLVAVMILLSPEVGERRESIITGLLALTALAVSTAVVLYVAAGLQGRQPALIAFMPQWFINPLDVRSWLRAAFHACVCLSVLLFPWEWAENLSLLDSAVYAGLIALVICLLATVGLWAWPGRGRRDVACWIIGPWLLTLLAGVAHRYPFAQPRMTAFLAAPLILAVATGLVRIGRECFLLLNARGGRGIAAAFILTLAPVFYMINAPLRNEYCVYHDFPVLLEILNKQRQPGDLLVVSYLAGPPVRFYIGRGGDPVVYVPNTAGSLPDLDYDYNTLAAETSGRSRNHWWVLCTSNDLAFKARRDKLLDWVAKQGYRLELVAEGGKPTTAGVGQLFRVTGPADR